MLGEPGRWPEFDPVLRKVRGVTGPALPGATLVGVSRVGGLALPMDVVEVVPASRLVLRVHAAPGVVETVAYDVTPVLQGGSDVRMSVVVEGLFARLAVVPLWFANGLTLRLLAARVERVARSARRAA